MNQKPDEDRLLEHNYDGIQEYDNPLPRWWVILFYATIVFAVLYYLNVPGIGTGKGRIANYERDMAAARAAQAAIEARSPKTEMTDAMLLAVAHDPARLELGKTTFVKQCSPCHRADGGGNIGPNLTDDFWIHGGKPTDLYHTVNTGVLDKGMPAWGQILKPDEVTAVVGYVITLHDTHPPDPKAPQGDKAEQDDDQAGGSAGSK